jgi:hypothetical protein
MTLPIDIVAAGLVAVRPLGARAVEGGNGFDDSFVGSSLSSDWLRFEGDGTLSTSVSGGVLDLTCNQGGSADSFWFNTEQGVLLYKLITGDFDLVMRGSVTNLARSGLPTVGDGVYRLAGIAAHDPDRGTSLNYVHVAWGCTASAGVTCEWKSTADSISAFDAVAAPTGAGELRILREGQTFRTYFRAAPTDAWTLVQEIDRDSEAAPLPATLQVGMMAYASAANHDIRLLVNSITITQ